MFKVTDRAASVLCSALGGSGATTAPSNHRLGSDHVDGQPQLTFERAARPEEGDVLVEARGLLLYVSRELRGQLDDAVLDVVGDPASGGLLVRRAR